MAGRSGELYFACTISWPFKVQTHAVLLRSSLDLIHSQIKTLCPRQSGAFLSLVSSPHILQTIRRYSLIYYYLLCLVQGRPMSEPDHATIQRAIITAQNATNDNLDQQTRDILALAVRALWSRIQAQPDSYLLTNLEARVFNYHQSLFRGNDLARRTLARYWENTHGSIDGLNGC